MTGGPETGGPETQRSAGRYERTGLVWCCFGIALCLVELAVYLLSAPPLREFENPTRRRRRTLVAEPLARLPLLVVAGVGLAPPRWSQGGTGRELVGQGRRAVVADSDGIADVARSKITFRTPPTGAAVTLYASGRCHVISRVAVISVFVGFGLAAVGIDDRWLTEADLGLAPVAVLVQSAMGSRPVRIAMLLVWWWLGWHFLVEP